MNWASGQVFEILAIGNGEFMHRVFLALSMLWSSGVFASLGALGLLVGLIGLGPQSVAAGGQRMDIGSLFLGFILWLLFFAGGATVQVQEVGYSRPGSTLPGTWVVDNVPFGVAATGWLVSNVGKRVTEKMEQAYGLVDEEQSVLKTGHGRALEWLAALRTAADLSMGSPNTRFVVERDNLTNHLTWCGVPALMRDKRRVPGIVNVTDPLDPDKGFGFNSQWHTTDWYTWSSAGGKPALDQDVTCTVSTERLRDYFQNPAGNAFKDFVSDMARPMGFYAGSTPHNQAVSAASQLNLTVDAAQRYMLASMMADLWHEAAARSPLLTQQEVANMLMMKQAVEQKATQSAGEESMFKRTMYPLMTFLESAFYITAPFMALVIGMGRLGIGMASKFVMIPLWLAMWLPTLAVINMYQIISFRSVIEGLVATSGNAGSAYPIGSLASAEHIHSSALDWMATGSMLAAATPMISLMFLMGGAYTATALAGAFRGSDVINEKLPSPDVSQPAAALQAQPLMRYSAQGGTEMVGASTPKITSGNVGSFMRQAGERALEGATKAFTETHGAQVASAVQNAIATGGSISQSDSHQVQQAFDRAQAAAKSHGVDLRQMSKNEASLAHSVATSLTAGGDLVTNARGVSASLGGKYSDESKRNEAVSRVMSAGASLASEMKGSASLKAAVTDSSATTAEAFIRSSGQESTSFTGTDSYQQMRADQQSAMFTSQTMSSLADSMGVSQEASYAQIARAMHHSGMDAQEVHSAIMDFGAPAFEDVKQSLIRGGVVANTPMGDGRITEADAATAFALKSGLAPGQTTSDTATMMQFAQERGRILAQSGAFNTNAGAQVADTMAAHDREVAPDARREAGMATGNVNAQDLGSGTSQEQVQSTYRQGRRSVDASPAREGGARARGLDGGDGTVDTQTFVERGKPLRAESEAEQAQLHEASRLASQPFAAEAQRNASGNSGFSGGFNRLMGIHSEQRAASFLNAVAQNSHGVTTPNQMTDQYIAAARDGNLFPGVPLTEDAAIYLGTLASAGGANGTPPSEEQIGRAFEARERLSGDEQYIADQQVARMDHYKGSYAPSDTVVGLPALARYQSADEMGSPGTPVPDNPDAQRPRPAHKYWEQGKNVEVFKSEQDRQWAMTLDRRSGGGEFHRGHEYLVLPE